MRRSCLYDWPNKGPSVGVAREVRGVCCFRVCAARRSLVLPTFVPARLRAPAPLPRGRRQGRLLEHLLEWRGWLPPPPGLEHLLQARGQRRSLPQPPGRGLLEQELHVRGRAPGGVAPLLDLGEA
mmetsp:Transcript_13227/g.45846  ORF Transcript_13227/g.45846 Transcript_13227/m.45846 type:complete len:125 (-) Transcript_13227:1157-1531(-)